MSLLIIISIKNTFHILLEYLFLVGGAVLFGHLLLNGRLFFKDIINDLKREFKERKEFKNRKK